MMMYMLWKLIKLILDIYIIMLYGLVIKWMVQLLKDCLKTFNINVLKPFIMKKYKLQELFNEIDNLKETLVNKEYKNN